MTAEYDRFGARPSREGAYRRPSKAPVPYVRPRHADLLALQRAVGNAATRVVLARQPRQQPPGDKAPDATPSPRPTFRVLIVDNGKTGLDAKTLDIAIGHVRDELRKLTAASANDAVKAGFTVEYRKTAPERDTDFGRRDLDVTTWIVFLVHKGDEKLAVDLGYHYLNLDHREREQREKNARADIATEGGHNLQTYSRKRRHPSESISFVGTDVPLKMQKTESFGPESAGRLMAEVVLHELGHAMGHVHYEGDDASKDHDASGIMAAATTVGSSGPYAPTSFSTASAEVIRKRLEWLAGIIAGRTKTP
jgi:hypothetical protein